MKLLNYVVIWYLAIFFLSSNLLLDFRLLKEKFVKE